MKTSIRSITILSVLVLTLSISWACSSTRSVGTQMDDGAITSKVNAKLAADPMVNPFNIDVDTVDGVVTLRGKVEKQEAKQHASELALSVSGVKKVENSIEVSTAKTGMREKISDSAITAKIKTKLASDPEIDPFNIDVDTSDGVVTLSGIVAKSSARSEAEKLARDTNGVQDVDNQIKVQVK